MPKLTLARAEQMLTVQRAQIETARRLFFRLAEVRAADQVRLEGKGWDWGAEYINSEMNGFDSQLSQCVPDELRPKEEGK